MICLKHKWVEPIAFTGRINIETGKVEKLWQCDKCGIVKHIELKGGRASK